MRQRVLCRVLLAVACLVCLPHATFAASTSVFTARPDDPAAVYVEAPQAQAAGDETARLQAALDRAGANPGGGLVFVPAGRYRVTRTLLVWRGVRVIGYGATRPVFVLPDRTPGFQTGLGVLIHFTHGRPPGAPGAGPGGGGRVPFPPPGLVPRNDDIPDANQSTFYSSMMNVDVELGDGNPAAAAIRFHVAQHGVLSHMDFELGSGLAGLVDVGNVGQDLRFRGGRYGILATNTSPYWPYTLIDSAFEGQREAAIREHTAGLTVIRTTFRDVPVGISIDPGYSDQLWLKDARFERVATAAIVFDKPQNASTEIGVEDAICAEVPMFARSRGEGPVTKGPAPIYHVRHFHHGLFVRGGDSVGAIDHQIDAVPLRKMLEPLPPALPALPPVEQWTNVRTLGVKGDGVTDDTQALQAAVDAHRVLYFPTGYYQVRDTIRLKPDTVLIALHPNTTQLDLPDRLDAFAGVGSPKGLIEAPSGGTTVVSGLGLFTGAINPRATAVLWMAGKDSFLDDIQIHGAGLTFFPPNVSAALSGPARPNAPPGPPGPRGRLGAQYPSIYVTRGGGGIFHNIWSANTYARSGFHVSDTATPGVVYELSAEHHLFSEIRLDRVQHWTFYGPQTEEEVSTSVDAVAFEITDSSDITIANYKAYRVARSYAPFPAAMRVEGASQVRLRNVAVNAEHGYGVCDAEGCGTILRAGKFAYDNAVEDRARGRHVRERLFAVLDLDPRGPGAAATAASATRAGAAGAYRGATVEKLADGFHSIAGAAVDAAGTLYFVDHRQQRIFSWASSTRLKVVRDAPFDPVNLGVDRAGTLLVLSSAGPAGSVYALRPSDPRDALTVLQPQPRPTATAGKAAFLLPAAIWTDGQFRNHLDLTTYEYETHAQMFAHEATTPSSKAYLSPDGSLILPAGRVFTQGPDGSYPGMDETGWRWSHALDAFGLIAARPGERVYIASGAENRTYRGVVRDDGTVGDLAVFAERGGEGAIADRDGAVYVANGQIFVYGPTGAPLGRIDVPERPTGLRFGGPGGRTLYVLTHHALYAVHGLGTVPARR